jgi:hypothetical protein
MHIPYGTMIIYAISREQHHNPPLECMQDKEVHIPHGATIQYTASGEWHMVLTWLYGGQGEHISYMYYNTRH